MLSHKDLLLQHLYYEEALRQAEKDRLIRLLRVGRKEGNRRHHRALNWLGSRLVAWGNGLQERYETPAMVSK
jgi:hypothetical protein